MATAFPTFTPFLPIVRTLTTPNGQSFDEAPPGEYTLIDAESCGEEKTFLGITVGALPAATLGLLAFLALARRRQRPAA